MSKALPTPDPQDARHIAMVNRETGYQVVAVSDTGENGSAFMDRIWKQRHGTNLTTISMETFAKWRNDYKQAWREWAKDHYHFQAEKAK